MLIKTRKFTIKSVNFCYLIIYLKQNKFSFILYNLKFEILCWQNYQSKNINLDIIIWCRKLNHSGSLVKI